MLPHTLSAMLNTAEAHVNTFHLSYILVRSDTNTLSKIQKQYTGLCDIVSSCGEELATWNQWIVLQAKLTSWDK